METNIYDVIIYVTPLVCILAIVLSIVYLMMKG